MAASVSFFLLPNELSSGGFSGIATIIYYIFKVPMGNTIVVLNIPLIILASFKIGKNFIFKSIIGKVIDIIFEGIYFTKLVFVVTDKSKEISDYIKTKIKRGVTGIYGNGMYSSTSKLVLMCALSRRDLAQLKLNIKNIDPKAFLIITNSREVLGIGFKE